MCFGMVSVESYLDDLLARGRAYFSRDEAVAALGLKPSALAAAIPVRSTGAAWRTLGTASISSCALKIRSSARRTR